MGPKLFWTIQIVLDGYKLFWSGPNRFGQVRIRLLQAGLLWTDFYNMDQSDQNDLDLTKTNWTRH